ncbi:hypothetical protein Pmar_PMAR021417 [Perkinsus marinus ATCC 50983]|uniref:SH3 domain-containing protein n=1 Tax=Perkinsus marinus (strain ATCC 50983 / TXsc) TaxID=423536 RepID=C5KX81_PERM5|nr:hypothetical protein Pmar_PMAR021417 [Perkinsus marinus ATCC 50983]EER10938.1 hypothetical protein Pmar_PMAR021417 [Perkinsus marinus ATCC 50983]|eukprot:XP_002779143.1 hypothetical protein Pmar_PMAR021417 [Perkinsus marinus ATCC 50983]
MMDVLVDYHSSTNSHHSALNKRMHGCSASEVVTAREATPLTRQTERSCRSSLEGSANSSDRVCRERNDGVARLSSCSSEGPLCISLGNFLARHNSSEVALRPGDEVTILDAGEGWSEIYVHRTGERGFAPSAFLMLHPFTHQSSC